jgi:hypothetical protein
MPSTAPSVSAAEARPSAENLTSSGAAAGTGAVDGNFYSSDNLYHQQLTAFYPSAFMQQKSKTLPLISLLSPSAQFNSSNSAAATAAVAGQQSSLPSTSSSSALKSSVSSVPGASTSKKRSFSSSVPATSGPTNRAAAASSGGPTLFTRDAELFCYPYHPACMISSSSSSATAGGSTSGVTLASSLHASVMSSLNTDYSDADATRVRVVLQALNLHQRYARVRSRRVIKLFSQLIQDAHLVIVLRDVLQQRRIDMEVLKTNNSSSGSGNSRQGRPAGGGHHGAASAAAILFDVLAI